MEIVTQDSDKNTGRSSVSVVTERSSAPAVDSQDGRLPAPPTPSGSPMVSLCPMLGDRHVRELLRAVQHRLAVLISEEAPIKPARLDAVAATLANAAEWARWGQKGGMR